MEAEVIWEAKDIKIKQVSNPVLHRFVFDSKLMGKP